MKNNGIKAFSILVLMLCSISANAHDEAAEEDTGPWSGFVMAGYLRSSGNTDTSTYNFAALAAYDKERWHHQLSALAIGGNENDSATSESYKLSYDVKFDVTDRLYTFGDVEWNKNRFSAYDQQMFETAGVGYRFLKTDRHELNGQAGVGLAQSDFRDARPEDPLPLDPLLGTSQNEVVYVLGTDYTWHFSQTASFVQALGTKIGSDNTYSFSVSELRASLMSNLALVLSYKIETNSDVPNGAKKRDSYTVISVAYNF